MRTLVTGASRGIGRAIAIDLARLGHSIVLNYRERHSEAEETLDLIIQNGGQATLLPFDVSDRSTSKKILEADLKQNGPYYGVVCNAGLRLDGPFPGMAEDTWDRVMRTNLDSFYNILKPCIMPMVRERKGGRIVTLTSTAGLVGNRGQVNYSASKAGLIGATRSLALELAKRKITVNSVAPGFIETTMTEEMSSDLIRNLVPMQRQGKPEEVSGVVSFLFSEVAAYITGQVISVNGGLV